MLTVETLQGLPGDRMVAVEVPRQQMHQLSIVYNKRING